MNKEYFKAYYNKNRARILEERKARYNANREELIEIQKAYYRANRDTVLAKDRKYIAENREAILTRRRARYAANRDRLLEEKKAYYALNRENIRERQTAYRHTGAGRTAFKSKAHRRRSRRRGSVATADVRKILAAAKCHICGKRFTAKSPAVLDHVIPLARGGLHVLSNLAAAHALCNAEKWAHSENPKTGQGILV